MSKIILLTILSIGFSAQAAKLVHSLAWISEINGEKTTKVSMGSGLGETGFVGPQGVCFIGKATDVCKAVQSAADGSAADYRAGNHGKFELNSCKVINGEYARQTVIQVNYTRINDYDDDLKLDLKITNCN